MLEKQMFNEFKEFSERRLANKYNVENDSIWERFYFASCGDEFFRDIEKVEKTVNETNPKRYKKRNSASVQKSEFYRNHLEFYYEKIRKKMFTISYALELVKLMKFHFFIQKLS